MQLPTEWVMINDERVATLIDSGCSRSIISSEIITGLRLKPVINEVLTMSGEKVRCVYESEVKITLRSRQLLLLLRRTGNPSRKSETPPFKRGCPFLVCKECGKG